MKFLFTLSLFFVSLIIYAQKDKLEIDIPYYSKKISNSNEYIKERCVLDLSLPTDSIGFATIVYFHGGGLSGGEKEIPQRLVGHGLAVVAPNYRLHPKVKSPTYVEDAAAAVAWVIKNIDQYGGNPDLVFISGHSAGGYLASMVGMDKQYLDKHDIDANQIAGLIPFSGHTITHFTVRQEMGIEGTQPIIDEMAPLYHVRKDASPLLLITGNRELELLGRYEENAYMYRMMQVVGHPDTRIMELDGYDHGMIEPALPLLLKEVQRITHLKNK